MYNYDFQAFLFNGVKHTICNSCKMSSIKFTKMTFFFFVYACLLLKTVLILSVIICEKYFNLPALSNHSAGSSFQVIQVHFN